MIDKSLLLGLSSRPRSSVGPLTCRSWETLAMCSIEIFRASVLMELYIFYFHPGQTEAEGPKVSVSSAAPSLPSPPPYLLRTARCTLPNHCGSRETERPVAWRAHSDFQCSGLQVWCTRNEFHNSGRERAAPGAMRKVRPCWDGVSTHRLLKV